MRKQLLATVLSLGMLVQFSSANASPTTKVTTKAKVSTNFKFMSDLLKSLKIDGVVCTNYKKNTSGVLGVREEGNCTFNRKDLTIDLFPDSKSALAIINAIKSFGMGYIVGTNNWSILVDDEETAKILTSGLKIKLY